jgi:putative hydrolase of HD superfamily
MESLFQFVKMLNAFRNVERVTYVNGENRQENDVEHSYHLAMIAWYLIEKENLPLNKDLVIQYALVHDLVEVYAGDTFFYTEDQALLDSKAEREQEALQKLKEEYPSFSGITEVLHRYEEKQDEESKFVYALDKIQPIINIYLDGGRTWKENDITLELLKEKKKEKVAVSPYVEKIFQELVAILEKESKLFEK